MRLGLYGGTFDPVHYGHLLLGECCREECHLDEVWFVPAAAPPHKRHEQLTGAPQRIEMLELAVAGHETFKVCRLEIERGGVSYTVDTLAGLREESPERELFFLLGADSLEDLPTWHQPRQICQLATLVVVCRPGSPDPDYERLLGTLSRDQIDAIRGHQVCMPLIGLSSTDIRRRVAGDQSIRYRTAAAVEQYILSHGLYRGNVDSPTADTSSRDTRLG